MSVMNTKVKQLSLAVSNLVAADQRAFARKAATVGFAAVGFFAGQAQAQVNIDGTDTTTINAISYASEISASSGFVLTAASATPLTISAALGTGVQTSTSGSVSRWIRFDLTNATFTSTAFTGANLGFTSSAGDCATPNTTSAPASVVEGGAAGDSYIVFQIQPAVSLASTDRLCLAGVANTIRLSSPASASIRYTLHQDQAASTGTTPGGLNATNGRLIDKNNTFARFTRGLNFSFGSAQTEYLAAAATNGAFTQFCMGSSGGLGSAGCTSLQTDSIATIGRVSSLTAATTLLNSSGAVLTTLSSYLSAASVRITTDAGNFTTGTGYAVGFSTNAADCSSVGGNGSLASDGSRATFTLPTTGTLVTTSTWLCAQVPSTSTTVIAAQNFSGTFVPTFTSGLTAASGTTYSTAVSTGTWSQDGVVLQSPMFYVGSGYQSQFQLVNTGGSAANCQITVYSPTGVITPQTTSVSVPSRSTLRIQDASTLLPANATASGGVYASVSFSCAAASNQMQGSYALSTASGTTIGPMLRPGSN